MFSVSYFTRKNGVKVLHWENSSKGSHIARRAFVLARSGAENVTLEYPSGAYREFTPETSPSAMVECVK